MKKIVYIVLFFFSTFVYSQETGITYQAVIYLPGGKNIPGVDIVNSPMSNRLICLKFSFVDSSSNIEYEEVVKTTTDEFGMVNLVIGTNTQTGGYASSFANIVWDISNKKLKVALDSYGNCASFEEISDNPLSSVPFAYAAVTAENISGVVNIANGGTGATSPVVARANLGLGNVNNTSDANKPISTATQTALNTKENAANKSVDVLVDGTSDEKFPSVKAVKTYVDTHLSSVSANIVDADTTTKGRIQLAGDLSGTAALPTVPGLALKENAANKSLNVTTDGTSDVKFPSVKAVKTYVDTAIAGATIADADATTKGKIQLAGDLSGTAALPTITANAITSSKVADNAITDAKIATVSGTKITGNITGNAANVTGVIGLANGGTGATTATAARTNLGLGSAATNNTSDFEVPLTINAPLVRTANAITIPAATATLNGYLNAADFNTFSTKIDSSEKAANNGVATLGNDGKIPSNQIPAISFQSANVVTSQAAMTAIAGAQVGSIAIRTDENKNYVLSALPASTLSNWLVLSTPVAVTTVNGNFGPNVSLTKSDLVLGNVDNTSDINKPISIDTQAALSLKANLASPTFTGTVSGITKAMVGLAQVDNTSDAAKPISTATQTALDLKANAADVASALALKENAANKSTTTTLGTSDQLFPTQNAVKTYADAKVVDGITDAVTTSAPTQNAVFDALALKANTTDVTTSLALKANATDVTTSLALKENVANKSTATDLGSTTPSDELYPSQKAVKAYVDIQSANAGVADSSITSAKIIDGTLVTDDFADGSVTPAKISGILPVTKGGTGASTVGGAKINLGLENVDNTTDAAKPISTATQTALNLKANASDVTTSLALKEDAANKSTTTTLGTSDQLFPTQNAVKTYTDAKIVDAITDAVTTSAPTQNAVFDALALKANASDVTTSLALKANATDVTTSLALKANLASPTFTGTVSGIDKTMVGLGNVEDTALSTWVGSNNLTTVGTITTGSWSGTVIGSNKGGAGTINGLLKADGAGVVSAAVAGTDYQAPLVAGTNFLVPNAAITGATKTKITYDAKGLVTAGADATTADIAPSTDRNYVTDAQATVLSNTSGANTGDETVSTIKSKLGITTLSGSNTGDQTISLTGDVTGSGTGSFATTIANNAVTDTKLDKSNIPLSGFAAAANHVDLGGKKLIEVADPDDNQDAATKNYVDTAIASITNLDEANIYVGNATSQATPVSLSGDVNMIVGGVTTITDNAVTSAKIKDGEIKNEDISATAGIVDTKLATIATAGKVSNSATTATELNTASTIVARDANGDFVAGTITAQLNGNAATVTTNANLTGDVTSTGNATTVGKINGTSLAGLTTGILKNTTGTGIPSIAVAADFPTLNQNTTGTATTATNIAGGAAGSIPYQTAAATTAMLAKGTDGKVLTLVSGLPSWETAPGISSVGSINATAVPEGAVISSGALKLAPANATNGGVVTTAAQTFAGAKTFFPTITASSGLAVGTNFTPKLTAAVANDILVGLDISPTFIPGTFYPSMYAMRVNGTANFTTDLMSNGTYYGSGKSAGNVAIGSGVLMYNTAGTENIGIGTSALRHWNQSGSGFNIGIGYYALSGSSFTTTHNIGIGAYALSNITTGSSNVAVGSRALYYNTTGSSNSAFGYQALQGVSTGLTGSNNAAFGNGTLKENTSGNQNAGFGARNLESNTEGSNNAAFGMYSMLSNTLGSKNTALGAFTLYRLNGTSGTLGFNNIAIGYEAGYKVGVNSVDNTTGQGSVLIGVNTRPKNDGDINEIVISGYSGTGNGMTGNGSNTTTIGNSATTDTYINGNLNVTNQVKIAGGTPGLGKVLTSDANGLASWSTPSSGGVSALAYAATPTNANGGSISGSTLTLAPADATNPGLVSTAAQTFAGAKSFNTDMKVSSLTVGKGAFSVQSSTAFGVNALSSVNSDLAKYNTAIGYYALKGTTTGHSNTAIGYNTLMSNTVGIHNIAIGLNSLNALASTSWNDVSYNTSVGSSALGVLATGTNNTALGTFAGEYLTSGGDNVMLGYQAASGPSSSSLVSLNQSIMIGANAKPAATGETNEIVIGYNSTGLGSNSTLIGNSSTTSSKIFGALNLPNTTVSSSSTTGALTVGGGAGIAGNVFTGASLNVGGSNESTSTSTGAIKTSGGIGAVGSIFSGGIINVSPSNAASGNGKSSSIGAQNGASTATSNGGNINLNTGSGYVGGTAGDVVMTMGTSTNTQYNGSLMINTTSNPIPNNSKATINMVIPVSQDGLNIKSMADGNNVLSIWQTGSSASNFLAFMKGDSQTVVGTISASTTATTYNTASDYRLKTDFKDFKGSKLLDSIKVYDYQWKIDGSRSFGVKAHELQKILPYAVSGEKDAVNADGSIKAQSVDYSKLVPVLIKALQEQETQIKDSQTVNTQLKEQLELLKEQLEIQNKRFERLEKLINK